MEVTGEDSAGRDDDVGVRRAEQEAAENRAGEPVVCEGECDEYYAEEGEG